MISGLVLVFIWAGEKEGGVVSLFGEKALCFCFGDFFFWIVSQVRIAEWSSKPTRGL